MRGLVVHPPCDDRKHLTWGNGVEDLGITCGSLKWSPACAIIRPVSLPSAGRMVRGGSSAAPRPALAPSHSDELHAMRLEMVQHMEQSHQLFQALSRAVATLDTLVFEHDTHELDPATATHTIALQAQTAQTEIIRGIAAAVVQPIKVAAAAVALDNAWVQLGSDYLNVAQLLAGASGSGGSLPGSFGFILSSADVRSLTIHATANFPAGAFLTFALFGSAVPTMDGGVLH